jgi:anti-sigma regulatory factor (Ser/Thr protein kinase)
MGSLPNRIARSYEADPESVGRARAELACFASRAGASKTVTDGVRLAVSEAVTNAVRHAYPLHPGEVRVRAQAVADEIEVVVSDDGCGVHRDDAAAHQGTTDRGLGFGLALICAVSDQMTLAPRSTGGTDVRMRFSLPGTGPGTAIGPL